MRQALLGIMAISVALLTTSASKDECGCIPTIDMTPDHVKCMNSAAAFYNCVLGTDLKPEDVHSYGFYIDTGEETFMNRVSGDEWNFTIKKYIRPNIRGFRIRGMQMKSVDGEPGEYLRREAIVRFDKNKKEREKLRKKALKEEEKAKEKTEEAEESEEEEE